MEVIAHVLAAMVGRQTFIVICRVKKECTNIFCTFSFSKLTLVLDFRLVHFNQHLYISCKHWYRVLRVIQIRCKQNFWPRSFFHQEPDLRGPPKLSIAYFWNKRIPLLKQSCSFLGPNFQNGRPFLTQNTVAT